MRADQNVTRALLVGLAHAGILSTADLVPINQAILPAYIAGLQDENWDVDPEEVRTGYLGSLAVRSALTCLPTHLLAESHADGAENTWVQRIELTRVIANLVADVARAAARDQAAR